MASSVISVSSPPAGRSPTSVRSPSGAKHESPPHRGPSRVATSSEEVDAAAVIGTLTGRDSIMSLLALPPEALSSTRAICLNLRRGGSELLPQLLAGAGSGLRTLDVSGSCFGDAGAVHLARGITQLPLLTSLSFVGCDISADAAGRIARGCWSHSSMHLAPTPPLQRCYCQP